MEKDSILKGNRSSGCRHCHFSHLKVPYDLHFLVRVLSVPKT
jgi:hypothetical protein